jgi:AcrR family transcriptional regulator
MPVPEGETLRADARRNRERIMAAARGVFEERGARAPRPAGARRAGVGIATLYRRFPDRQALIREVARDIMARVAAEARSALHEEPDPFSALARYMHRALDTRIAALMPALAADLPLTDPEFRRLQDTGADAVSQMIETAQRDGLLRSEIAFGDIGLILIRLARPLPGPLPKELDRRTAHRHLDLLLAGMRPPREGTEMLPGPALGLDDLRAFQPEGALDETAQEAGP